MYQKFISYSDSTAERTVCEMLDDIEKLLRSNSRHLQATAVDVWDIQKEQMEALIVKVNDPAIIQRFQKINDEVDVGRALVFLHAVMLMLNNLQIHEAIEYWQANSGKYMRSEEKGKCDGVEYRIKRVDHRSIKTAQDVYEVYIDNAKKPLIKIDEHEGRKVRDILHSELSKHELSPTLIEHMERSMKKVNIFRQYYRDLSNRVERLIVFQKKNYENSISNKEILAEGIAYGEIFTKKDIKLDKQEETIVDETARKETREKLAQIIQSRIIEISEQREKADLLYNQALQDNGTSKVKAEDIYAELANLDLLTAFLMEAEDIRSREGFVDFMSDNKCSSIFAFSELIRANIRRNFRKDELTIEHEEGARLHGLPGIMYEPGTKKLIIDQESITPESKNVLLTSPVKVINDTIPRIDYVQLLHNEVTHIINIYKNNTLSDQLSVRSSGDYIVHSEAITFQELGEIQKINASKRAGKSGVAVSGIILENTPGFISHVALKMREMGLPSVVSPLRSSEIKKLKKTKKIALYATHDRNYVIINPNAITMENIELKATVQELQRFMDDLLNIFPAETEDGVRIVFRVNAGDKEIPLSDEIGMAEELRSNGIGLFRSEYMLLKYRKEIQSWQEMTITDKHNSPLTQEFLRSFDEIARNNKRDPERMHERLFRLRFPSIGIDKDTDMEFTKIFGMEKGVYEFDLLEKYPEYLVFPIGEAAALATKMIREKYQHVAPFIEFSGPDMYTTAQVRAMDGWMEKIFNDLDIDDESLIQKGITLERVIDDEQLRTLIQEISRLNYKEISLGSNDLDMDAYTKILGQEKVLRTSDDPIIRNIGCNPEALRYKAKVRRFVDEFNAGVTFEAGAPKMSKINLAICGDEATNRPLLVISYVQELSVQRSKLPSVRTVIRGVSMKDDVLPLMEKMQKINQLIRFSKDISHTKLDDLNKNYPDKYFYDRKKKELVIVGKITDEQEKKALTALSIGKDDQQAIETAIAKSTKTKVTKEAIQANAVLYDIVYERLKAKIYKAKMRYIEETKKKTRIISQIERLLNEITLYQDRIQQLEAIVQAQNIEIANLKKELAKFQGK